MPKQKFRAELLLGHKGAAVLVPFDPATAWGSTAVAAPIPGRLGHPVRGKIGGVAFEGFIGKRWGRHFVLVDPALQEAAGCAVGDVLEVELSPAETRTERGPKPRADKTERGRKPRAGKTGGARQTRGGKR